MKKIVAIILCALMLLSACFCLASCEEKVVCSVCEKEGRISTMESYELLGETLYTCQDCIDKISNIFN